MSKYMTLNIITPDKKLYSAQIEKLITENIDGKIEILYNHINMITFLNPSITEFIEENNKKTKLFTSYGIMNVKNNTITLSCDAAEWSQEIDYERAENAKKRAEKRLKDKDKDMDVERAEAALKRALVRLQLKDIP